MSAGFWIVLTWLVLLVLTIERRELWRTVMATLCGLALRATRRHRRIAP